MMCSWIRNVFARPVSHPIRRAPHRPRLAVEALEDRTVPSTFTVTNTNDSGAGSLRDAIIQAQSGGNVGVADTIVFNDGTLAGTNFYDATPHTITLTGGQLLLNDTATTTISGPGQSLLTISGNNASCVFNIGAGPVQVPGASVALSGLTITEGIAFFGGGVANVGTLTMTDCTVSDSSASIAGGGLWNAGGTVTLTNCNVSDNSSVKGGGILSNSMGTLNMTGCTVTGNSASFVGGGVYNAGTGTLTNCTVSGSSASGGAGVYNYGPTTTLNMSNCIVSGNSGGAGAGLLNIGNSTATLTDCIVNGNTSNSQGGGVDGNGTLTLNACHITGNIASGNGGGLYGFGSTTTLTNCIVSGNTAGSAGGGIGQSGGTVNVIGGAIMGNSASGFGGGGIFNRSGAALTVGNTTIADNSSNFVGGGVLTYFATTTLANCNVSDNAAAQGGGGLCLQTSGTLTLTDCTVTHNSAGHNGGGLENANGTVMMTGGRVNNNSATIGAGLWTNGTTTLDTCTVSGNTASNGGGGLWNTNGSNYGGPPTSAGALALTNCIVSGNTTAASNGGGLWTAGATALLTCIFSGNSSGFGGGGIDNESGTATLINSTLSDNNSSFGGGLRNLNGSVTLTNCTISGNHVVPNLPSGATTGSGGGLRSRGGTLTMTDCTISGNTADRWGGGLYLTGNGTLTDCTISANSAGVNGGAVYKDSGTLTVSGSTLTDNVALNGSGGGIFSFGGPLTAANSTLTNNSAGQNGGGLDNEGNTVTLSNCTVSGNSAGNNGGGINNYGQLTAANSTLSLNSANGYGGGIANFNSLTVSNSSVSQNTATSNAGGIINWFGATLGLTNAIITGNTSGAYGGGVSTFGPTTITGGSIDHNSAAQGGGALDIYNSSTSVAISGTLVQYNTAVGDGGAIHTNFGPALTVTNCTISNNTAGGNGGGVFNLSATLTVTGSTLSGNTASQFGGGLFSSSGTATVTNSTLASNSAGVSGGGIEAQGDVTVTSCTLSANRAISSAGGGIDNFFGNYTVTVGNSILAGNTAIYGPDFQNGVISLGNNLIGMTDFSGGWVASDLTGTSAAPLNPLLAPLGNYGGPTQTMALLPGSPAIDAGSATGAPGTDQRGSGRVGAVDIGAFESSGFTIAVTSGSGQATAITTAFSTPLVVTVTPNNASEPVVGGMVTLTPPPSGASAALGGNPAIISATGTASVTATANGIAGSYTVSATGSGITTPASFSLTNNPATTSTLVISSANPSVYGQAVSFIATVINTSSGSSAVPTGTVTFFDGATLLGTAPVNGLGQATLTTTTLSAGVHGISAHYSNSDGNFLGSTSTNLAQTVTPATLTITANNDTKAYGTSKTFSGTAFTATGLVNGDTITGVTETSTGAPASAAVGSYAIVPSAATGTGLSNYTITYVNGTLLVGNATSLSANFNGSNIQAGNYLWFSSVLHVSGLSSTATTTIWFVNQTITIGSQVLPVPNASITYHPGTGTSTTVFTAGGWWQTDVYIGSGLGGNQFLAGLGYYLPSSLAGGTKNVTWSGVLFTDQPGVSLSWKWAAAVYTHLPFLGSQVGSVDYNAMGIKPVDDTKSSVYKNGDHAGTPEGTLGNGSTIKSQLIGGGMGGGGSDYTGGYSGALLALPTAALDDFFTKLGWTDS